jgi:hypothetical protein
MVLVAVASWGLLSVLAFDLYLALALDALPAGDTSLGYRRRLWVLIFQ